MGVYKRGKFWYLDYYLPGGVRKREKTRKTSRKQAEELLAVRTAEIVMGTFKIKKQEQLLFGDFVAEYFEHAKGGNIKQSTLDRYLVSMHQLMPYFSERLLHTITAYDIEKYRTRRRKDKPDIRPATLNRDIAFLRRLFNMARKWGKVERNPVDDVDLLPEDNIRTRYLEVDEVSRLLVEASKNAQLFLAVSIALHTGMRRGEILSLCIPHSVLRKDEVNWVDLPGRCFHLNVTKTRKYRRVPINKVLYPLIEDAVATGTDRLFTVKQIRSSFEAAVKRADLNDVVFHDLRRTFISQAMNAGYSQEVIQRVVGQDDPSIFKRYAHLAEGREEQVIEAVGELFCRAKKQPGTPASVGGYSLQTRATTGTGSVDSAQWGNYVVISDN